MRKRAGSEVGQRVAELRKLRGLTQAGLAARLHRSPSWVTKIERGERQLDSMAVLRELSQVLGVSVVQLTGQADRGAPGEVHGGESPDLVELRRIMDRPASAGVRDGAGLRPVADVYHDAMALMKRHCTARNNYSDVLPSLPRLIDEAQCAVVTSATVDRRRAYSALATLYRLVAAELDWLGGDMARARIAMDRAFSAAAAADDPLLLGSVAAIHTLQLIRQGDAAEAVTAALDIADMVARDGGVDKALGAVVVGSLRQFAAKGAARAGDGTEARRLMRAVVLDAERVGRDRGAYGQNFGLANATNTEVDTLTYLGRPLDAIRRAEGLRAEWLGAVNRIGFHYRHLARAYHMTKQDDCALAAIANGLRIAPEMLRLEGTAAAVVREMLQRRRRAGEQLRRIARQLYVDY